MGALKQSTAKGGKEELRASVLKPYLLRLRSEKGEKGVRQLLNGAGIDPAAAENETSWLSVTAVRRALRGIVSVFGEDALRKPGEWATSPEALGTLVRMLRTAEHPVDAYRFLAQNYKEITRIAVYELDETAGGKQKAGAKKSTISEIRVSYKIRPDAIEDGIDADAAGEDVLCAAREGQLSSFPRIWGLDEATITHESCIAKGGDACIYHVSWQASRPARGALAVGLAAAVLVGALMAVVGGIPAAILGAVLGGALGAGVGFFFDRTKGEEALRVFEKNRIKALERGLDLRGETAPQMQGELTGTVLGAKYKIGRKIGSGGIGVVYAAEHTSLGHEVAVKVLRGAAARDGGEIARLRREAHIQVHIEHPNVCRVLDLDQMPDGSMYVVMERLHGKSLADKLSRDYVVTPGFGIPIFIDVCRALQAAHTKDVVHRDLKPGNIFLCDDGHAKVLDFGMSKLTSAESLTQQGYTLGTPEYMAPEQCIGAPVEPRTDLYAFGVLMYEAFTGELPIQAPSRRELLDMHQRQAPEPMRTRRPDLDIPKALDDLVLLCLKKKAVDRPKDAAALEAMLAAIPLEGLPKQYPPGVGRKKASLPVPPVKDQEDQGTMTKVDAAPPSTRDEPKA